MTESAVEREGKKVISVLLENGHLRDAQLLAAKLDQLSDPHHSFDALESIISMCHVRWLGDKNIKTLKSHREWLANLNRLSKAASKAKNRIDQ